MTIDFQNLLEESLDDTLNDIKNLQPSSGSPEPSNPSVGTTPQAQPAVQNQQQSAIRVQRYKNSRNFGVWWGNELIVVAVYLKGANRVAELLRQLEAKQ